MDLMTNGICKLDKSHSLTTWGETPLPMKALRELLCFLSLDDRERFTALNCAFARIRTPSVNAQRERVSSLDRAELSQ